MQDFPLVLPVQACKPAAMHVLCEMPGNLDIDGDSGVIGRFCRPLSSAHQDSGLVTAGEHVCMDLKGIDISCVHMQPISSTACNVHGITVNSNVFTSCHCQNIRGPRITTQAHYTGLRWSMGHPLCFWFTCQNQAKLQAHPMWKMSSQAFFVPFQQKPIPALVWLCIS